MKTVLITPTAITSNFSTNPNLNSSEKFSFSDEERKRRPAPDWWKQEFSQEVYLVLDAASVQNEVLTKSEIDLVLSELKPQPSMRIMDICCGQGRHSLELASRGFSQITGFDYSSYLLEQARVAAQAKSLEERVTFVQGDARSLPYADATFDLVVSMGNSFGYFEADSDDLLMLQEIRRILKPNGHFWLDITNGDYQKTYQEARVWKWLEPEVAALLSKTDVDNLSSSTSSSYIVCFERFIASENNRLDGSPDYRLVSSKFLIDLSSGIIGQSMGAVRLYNPPSMGQLLLQAGFSEQHFWGNFSPANLTISNSGMMSQRIIMIAKK